jgi:predicted secreted Zn-dependent protease
MNVAHIKPLKIQIFLAVLPAILAPMLCFSQFRYAEVPIIKIEDYKGNRGGAKFAAYTTSRVYYRIDTAIKLSDNKFKVLIRTKVEMNKEASFFDTTRLHKEYIPKLLNHEQGHLYLAYIAANKLEREMAKLKFSSNFVAEVRDKFREFNQIFGQDDLLYDKETNHSGNDKAQKKWDEKFRKLLE